MRRREPLAPDITPLIDVVFILLIFFMVTSVFRKEEAALLLQLPDVVAAPLPKEKHEQRLELSADALAFEGRPVSLEALEGMLEKGSDAALVLAIDKAVTYERIAEVMALLQRMERTNLALVTEPRR